MSGKGGSGGKSVTSSGTNGQGNTYTNYSDGGYRLAAFLFLWLIVFRYSNSSGSSYYDTGKGHSFYNRWSAIQLSYDLWFFLQWLPGHPGVWWSALLDPHQPEPGLLHHQVQVIFMQCCQEGRWLQFCSSVAILSLVDPGAHSWRAAHYSNVSFVQ